MGQRFEASQWVPFPIELVFAFFANPGNLPHLMPAWQRTRVESSRLIAPPRRPVAEDPKLRFQSPAAGVGSEMEITFRPVPWLPIRVGWVARIAEFEWNSHFCDEQVRGPFASWRHCHRTVTEVREGENGTVINGTAVRDEVAYTLPLGPLGDVANAVFVQKQMETTFGYRRTKLEEILPVAARQAGMGTKK